MKNWSLNQRIITILVVFVISNGLCLGVGLSGLHRMNSMIDDILGDHVMSLKHSKMLGAALNDLGDAEKSYILHGQIKDDAGKIADQKRFEGIGQEIQASLKVLSDHAGDDEKKLITQFNLVYSDWTKLDQKLRLLVDEQKIDEAVHLAIEQSDKLQDKMDESLVALTKISEDSMKEADDNSDLLLANSQRSLLASTIIGLLAGIIGAAIFLRSLNRTLSSVVGDITQKATDFFNTSKELESTSDQLSQSSTQAAASVEETTASTEEISSMIKLNSEGIRQSSTLAQEGLTRAQRGQEQSEQLSVVMKSIVQNSRKIEEIITVIEDIAFQTNLLALNASVEAARAGEQGKGFAVVAEAVRTLAQKSSSSAKEINDLIKASAGEIVVGSRLCDETTVALRDIVESVKKVSNLSTEVSAASTEQAAGIQQIARAINDIDKSTQTNAAASEEISASSRELNVFAEKLQESVVTLNGLVRGQNSAGGVAS